MSQEDFDRYEKMTEAELCAALARADTSPGKHFAQHILSRRAMQPSLDAAREATKNAKLAAIASMWAAFASVITALASLAALFIRG